MVTSQQKRFSGLGECFLTNLYLFQSLQVQPLVLIHFICLFIVAGL